MVSFFDHNRQDFTKPKAEIQKRICQLLAQLLWNYHYTTTSSTTTTTTNDNREISGTGCEFNNQDTNRE